MTVMPMPREKWTDERLDDLNKKVDKGFEDVKDAIAGTKAEIAETKAEMREGFARVDTELRAINARFDALNRTLLVGAVAIIAALIGSNAF